MNYKNKKTGEVISAESYNKLSFFNKMHFEEVHPDNYAATHTVTSEPESEDDDNFGFGLLVGGMAGAVIASEMNSSDFTPPVDVPSTDTSSFGDSGGFGGGDFAGGGGGGDW